MCAIIFLNGNYNFKVGIFGRKQSGKTSFFLMMLDRNDISIQDTFQNEDYYKVSYLSPNMGMVSVYKYIGFESNLLYLEDILSELSSAIDQFDYIFYFIDSINDINEFDRRFIQRLKEKGSTVFCVFNRRSREEGNKTQLYIEQGNLNVSSFYCNCTNRLEVMGINVQLEQYAKDETTLYDLAQFLQESPKTVLFLDPIQIGRSAKDIYLKYFQLFKAVASKSGTVLYMNKERLKYFLEQGTLRPDVLITGEKVLLDVDDMKRYV